MRILIEVDSSDIRIGAINDMLDLCRYGKSQNIEFYLCGNVNNVLREAAEKSGFRIVKGKSMNLNKAFALQYIASVMYWLIILKRIKVNVVHLNYVSWGPSLACAAKILKIGLVSRAGGIFSPKNLTCKWTDYYLANCEAQASHLLNTSISHKVKVVGDLINIDRIKNVLNENFFSSTQKNTTPKLLFLGQLIERKGIDVLVQAIAHMECFAELLIVGGDWNKPGYPTAIKQLIKNYKIEDQVKMFNHRTDAINFLLSCDVFVLPSLSEARPRSIIEAMLIGKCVVSTNTGGIPTLIQNECTGILVPPGDHHALAAALDKVCFSSNLRNKYGASAKEYALRTFDINLTIANYLKVYKKAASQASNSVKI